MGDVRLCQLRLHHGGDYSNFQCLLRWRSNNNEDWGTFAWTASLGVSYALIIVAAPLLGAYADAYAAKKRLLLLTTVGCVSFTALLYFIGPGDLGLAILLIVLSNFFFSSGKSDCCLFAGTGSEQGAGKSVRLGLEPRLYRRAGQLGRIAGVCHMGPEYRHASRSVCARDNAYNGSIFAVACIPTFLFLKERALPQPHLLGGSALREAVARLAGTLHQVREFRDLLRFLACLVFYQAGIQTVITLAAIYAQQVMHFDTGDTMFLVLVVNVTASVGALAFGSVQDRIGHIPTIALTLCGWLLMVLLAWSAESRSTFLAGCQRCRTVSRGLAIRRTRVSGFFQPECEAG